MPHHFSHFWRHTTFDPLSSAHFDHSRFHRRMMYYRGPSRILWFAAGAFAATWYHRAHARGEIRGWGHCGNRRIEEWRAERAAEAATKDQFSSHSASQQKQNGTAGEWSWKPAVPPSFEDEEVRRRWEDKTKKAQETVRAIPCCVTSPRLNSS